MVSSHTPIRLDMYKGILVDVDGTLVTSQKQVTPRTATALQTVADHQVKVGLCTGRALSQLAYYLLPFFPLESLHVVSGGAQVISTTGKVVWSKPLASEVVFDLCQAADRYGCSYGFGSGMTYYASGSLLQRFTNDAWQVNAKPAGDLDDWSTGLLSINDLNPEIWEVINQTSGITVKKMLNRHGQLFLDITAAGVTKAVGFYKWAELQGYEVAECIGVGDNHNDLEFLQIAGHAVAMGNATDEVKDLANQVIASNDAEGLAQFLEQIATAHS
jgi:5-amino-6-(5-phospho-D-ribitylamino)uracil phosphatase